MGLLRKEKRVDILETKPHFFTVIVCPALQLRKLRLPKKFAKNYGKHLSNFAYLQVPNGADWPVELLKCNGIVWLHRGWKQFAEHYSIAFGHFIVFRYDGHSRFRVLIFDKTTLEIDYSYNDHHRSVNHNAEFRGSIVERTEGDQGIDDDTLTKILDDFFGGSNGPGHKVPYASRHLPAGSTIPCGAKGRVLQRAKAFKSHNPLFILPMYNTYICCKLGPSFPASHCRTYFSKDDKNNDIVLCVNERTWYLKYRFEKCRSFLVRLSFGWREFMLDNELQEGDVCVFELIDLASKAYNVNIFRISDQMANPVIKDEDIEAADVPIEFSVRSKTAWIPASQSNFLRATATVKERVLPEARAFLGENPGFIITIRKSHLDSWHGVLVPVCHAREYFKDDGDDNAIVLYGKDQKTWHVKYRFEKSYPSCRAMLSIGWDKFRMDNHLKLQDVCVFEMMNGLAKSYRVTIFYAKEG